MNKLDFDIRNIGHIEKRDDNSNHISGYAVVFNSMSEDMGFREIILPTAITQETLDNSDIMFLFDHKEDKVLGRYNKKLGCNSLNLTIDATGLKFDFELDERVDLHREVMVFIERGDISKCSFAFYVNPDDQDAQTWEKLEDGTILRTIKKIELLADCSVVWNPAYMDTQVSKRNLEKINELREKDTTLDMNEEQETIDDYDYDYDYDTTESEERSELSDTVDNQSIHEVKEEEEKQEENSCEEDKNEEEEQKRTNISIHNIMNKNFSLLKAIRSVVNNKPFDEITSAVINDAKNEFRGSGLNYNGQIQLPTENRAVTVTTEHDDLIQVDVKNVIEPLKKTSVVNNLGINILTGLTNDVKLPYGNSITAKWASEVGDTLEQTPAFGSKNLKPHRLTAQVVVSKSLIMQDSVGAENLIYKLIQDAVSDKLEATMFGTGAGDTDTPKGLLNGITPTYSVDTFKKVVDLEAALEENLCGTKKYVVGPKAKALVRSLNYNKSTRTVWENGEIDGTPAVMTQYVDTNSIVCGDFSGVYLASWGAQDITIDPFTKAGNNEVIITINSFFDFTNVYPNSIVVGNIGEAPTAEPGE